MKYYFIGIKGTGMSSLATIMHDLGNTIIGYDDYKDHKFTEDPLIKRNIKIYKWKRKKLIFFLFCYIIKLVLGYTGRVIKWD
mgnify:CR=1 FL=1